MEGKRILRERCHFVLQKGKDDFLGGEFELRDRDEINYINNDICTILGRTNDVTFLVIRVGKQPSCHLLGEFSKLLGTSPRQECEQQTVDAFQRHAL